MKAAPIYVRELSWCEPSSASHGGRGGCKGAFRGLPVSINFGLFVSETCTLHAYSFLLLLNWLIPSSILIVKTILQKLKCSKDNNFFIFLHLISKCGMYVQQI
mmetsp:Transcript_22123/g.39608  ORF Transcript_22123/g.39608 Transcript_22123/m.39608 type:complete len:103 (-) Transcript_22123:555-863(-)